MTTLKKLPDAEFDIMKVLWQIEPPVTAGALLEALAAETRRAWKPQTLHTLLGRLEGRGFLRSEKNGKEKTFYPLIARETYLQFETKDFMRHYHDGSLLNLVNAAYEGESLRREDIDELVRWATARREE